MGQSCDECGNKANARTLRCIACGYDLCYDCSMNRIEHPEIETKKIQEAEKLAKQGKNSYDNNKLKLKILKSDFSPLIVCLVRSSILYSYLRFVVL